MSFLGSVLIRNSVNSDRDANDPHHPPKVSTLILEGTMISKETLFAVSLFPYLGFLWFLTRSPDTPRLALAGFYGTLVFVAVTIPAGIYAEVVYHEALANVDPLHGGAELFLTLSNILVVVGFYRAIQKQKQKQI